jgi:hypothetical protein
MGQVETDTDRIEKFFIFPKLKNISNEKSLTKQENPFGGSFGISNWRFNVFWLDRRVK